MTDEELTTHLEERKEYILELSKDFLDAHKKHYHDASIASYNELRRIARALAQAHLVDKATFNVKAAIELEKSYPEAPPLNDPAHITQVEDVSETQMSVAQGKMEMRTNISNTPLTLKAQQTAYENGTITLKELHGHLKAIDLMQKAEAHGKITGDMIIHIGERTVAALASVRDDGDA